MNYGIINNLFGDHVPDTENMARSRIEKMTGPLPEADWSEMKEIFRDFAFGSLKALRSPTAGSMKKRCLASNISMESQVSLCSSSTSLPFKPVPHAKRHTGPSNRGILDHEDASPPVPNRDRRTAPDIAEVLPGIDIDFWLTEIPGIFGQSSRPSPPLRPSPESPLNQLSQLSPPSRACPAGQSSQPSQQREQSQSVTVADKVKFAIEGPSPTQEAAEDVIHTQQEATAETCEEKVSNNLKLTPEECLAAALQQKTPPWQGPEDDSSHD
ncbi:hypothetical protein GQ607_011118 [Colletotrichum asianum]|uniref:Uncharacterized protein n=1 Tax=Colletotrichum asianum TaxID=702518 RepID=A0A8H3W8T3_9PEZI|nr:hypothetical protein GQ607_011118 [Colletotrichum asianum]